MVLKNVKEDLLGMSGFVGFLEKGGNFGKK